MDMAVRGALGRLGRTTYSGQDPSSGAGPVGASSVDEPRPRTFAPAAPDGLTRAAAIKFCQPGATISKNAKETRWRCSATAFCGPKSKRYGVGTGLNDYKAMVVVLLSQWQGQKIATGVECNFEFDGID